MKLQPHLQQYHKTISQAIRRRRLRNRTFTIISNNCWGGEVYRDLDLSYQTPFVGLFLFSPCYLKLLNTLHTALASPLEFTDRSRYAYANDFRDRGDWSLYPIGVLNHEIEIHFMHYRSPAEATEKWARRVQRITWEPDQLFFKFCDNALCSPQLIQEFDRLSFPNKVCFTGQSYPDLKSTVWIKACNQQGHVMDGGTLYQMGHRYFDVVQWLNGGMRS